MFLFILTFHSFIKYYNSTNYYIGASAEMNHMLEFLRFLIKLCIYYILNLRRREGLCISSLLFMTKLKVN